MKQIYYLLDYDRITLVDVDDDHFLDECYRLIDCDCIDIVHTYIPNVVMVVDDCGAIKPDQLYNKLASELYIYGIFGKALLAYQKGPDLVPLPDYAIQLVYNHFIF